MLLQERWLDIIHVAVTAVVGTDLLSRAVQGWLFSHAGALLRTALAIGGLTMIVAGWTNARRHSGRGPEQLVVVARATGVAPVA
ncbi:hypothetical protein GCM10011415_20950 [Salipiger pallidus]|uniref:Uncharacterized protein n=1 Tax=Salipiger pallidus TaxID=1775170 RepID=A0A8J2ZJR4_9RHOB|nr:hypothetical protein [Salipiger pallidus]GGG72661.1 hypothetical protein GCM10011415_20950 [Salipiger pallidus]